MIDVLVFLDNSGSLVIEDNPKILAAIIAIIVGFFSKNIIATISSGLFFYWILIFLIRLFSSHTSGRSRCIPDCSHCRS